MMLLGHKDHSGTLLSAGINGLALNERGIDIDYPFDVICYLFQAPVADETAAQSLRCFLLGRRAPGGC
jgi:hypothetical protein